MAQLAKDRLNDPAWTGGSPFFEDYYLKANLPDQDASLWVRYTLRSPSTQPGQARVWAIVDQAGEVTAARETHPVSDLTLEGDPFVFRTPAGDLSSDACGGEAGPIRWELTWDPTPYAFLHLPRWAYELPDVVTKTVTPNPDLSVHGQAIVDGERIELDGAPGQQGHVWGAKHADGWAWGHGNVQDGPVWEAAALRAEALGREGPTLGVLLLRHEGETLAFRNPVANRAAFGPEGLELTATRTGHRARLEITPRSLSRIPYTDPDGETAWCHNTKRARASLTLEERGWRGWRSVATWQDQAPVAFELGLREPLASVEAVL